MEAKPIRFVKKTGNDHDASVVVFTDGQFKYLSEDIITPNGLSKTNKQVRIQPEEGERIVDFSEAPYYFETLGHMNIILTNACNLSCTYCYEQHNKDFGRFTEDSLLHAYNFLLKYSKEKVKRFQFFGGEPLIHKKLILNFLDNNSKYLRDSALNHGQIVGMITNGLLLDTEFLNSYFKHDFTKMMISLDTLDAEIDHRELEQKEIDNLIKLVQTLPNTYKDKITFRCTISQETAPNMVEYVEKLHDIGINDIIIHPLIHSSGVGFIKWEESKWNKLHQDLLYVLDKFKTMKISFSEGVGKKGENNCMVGSDMIAIDGSGDFSGCYFFTNQKANIAGSTILGNIFEEKLYIDRYVNFQKAFTDMIDNHEQCKSCDYKEMCYQCPAGNITTGKSMFYPDEMCQSVVKLYNDLQEDIRNKMKDRTVNTLSIYLGDTCNFDCVYCDRSYIKSIGGQNISKNDIEEIGYFFDNNLDYFSAVDRIALHGGEPFLYVKRMDSILERLKNHLDDKGLYVSITTNASLIEKEEWFIEKWKKYLRLTISYDFIFQPENREEFDIYKVIDICGGYGVPIHWQFVMPVQDRRVFSIECVKSIVDIINHTKNQRRTINLIALRHYRGGEKFTTFLEDMDIPQFADAFIRFINTLYNYNVEVFIDGNYGVIDKNYFGEHYKMILSPDGYIYPEYDFCEYKTEEFRVGTWKGEAKFYQYNNEDDNIFDKCKTCSSRPFCGLKYLHKMFDTEPGEKCKDFYFVIDTVVKYTEKLGNKRSFFHWVTSNEQR